MRRLLVTAAAALMFGFASAASAYVGDWSFDNNPGGWEVLNLGNNSDGNIRYLSGTDRYCGVRGASYATMRNVLRRNGTSGEQINWWEDRICGDYVRICVENWRGESACSTYWDEGWDY